MESVALVSASETEMVQRRVVMPSMLNPNGTMFGGALLSIYDEFSGIVGLGFVKGKIMTVSVETVVLLSKLNTKQHIEVELNLDELDLTSAESKATYDEIKAYVLEKHGLKVSSLYISQVKRKCGLDVGQNYNLSKKEDAKVPQCPPEKEAAIMDALKHFQMI